MEQRDVEYLRAQMEVLYLLEARRLALEAPARSRTHWTDLREALLNALEPARGNMPLGVEQITAVDHLIQLAMTAPQRR